MGEENETILKMKNSFNQAIQVVQHVEILAGRPDFNQ